MCPSIVSQEPLPNVSFVAKYPSEIVILLLQPCSVHGDVRHNLCIVHFMGAYSVISAFTHYTWGSYRVINCSPVARWHVVLSTPLLPWRNIVLLKPLPVSWGGVYCRSPSRVVVYLWPHPLHGGRPTLLLTRLTILCRHQCYIFPSSISGGSR